MQKVDNLYKIYEVRNKLNGKVFVGATTHKIGYIISVLKNKRRNASERALLIEDIRKYGLENFEIEIVEEFDSPNDQQNQKGVRISSYPVEKLYNQRTVSPKDELILAEYERCKNLNETSRNLGIHVSTVYMCLRRWGIQTRTKAEVLSNIEKISDFSYRRKEDNEKIVVIKKDESERIVFNNIYDAADYLTKFAKSEMRSVLQSIKRCLNNDQKSSYGYRISKLEEGNIE